MDTIYFEPSNSKIEDYRIVDIYINGINLIDIARQVEFKYTVMEGCPGLAGAYEGLPAIMTLPPSKHFLGQAHNAYSYPDNKAAVLEYAQSGIPGDWTLIAKITVSENAVTWSGFEQIKRNGSDHNTKWYYELEFSFDLGQYSDALIDAAGEAY